MTAAPVMSPKKPKNEHQQDRIEEGETVLFKDNADICQQLMDRYAKSSAPQHRHLLAAAAAMRSMLVAESLPLTPPAYFAAGISAADSAVSSPSVDHTAVSALLSFLSIVVPMVPPEGIASEKAREAVVLLTVLVERERDKLGVASLRPGVKCLGFLLVGFCDLGDWHSVQLGFDSLLKFSIDKRPKVRKCAQECLENIFRSFKSSSVIKNASKTVYSLLKEYMPVATTLSADKGAGNSKGDLKSGNLEALHLLNLLSVIIPFLSVKVSSKIFLDLCKLMTSEFSALARPLFKAIDIFFGTSKEDIAVPVIENIIACLIQYISMKDKYPMDTIMHAATLSRRAFDKLYSMDSRSCIKKFPLVCGSMAGLLTSMDDYASQASVVLMDLINHQIDWKVILTDRKLAFEDEDRDSEETGAIRSICSIFESSLNSCDATCNKHILSVLSLLFQKLGELSSIFMKNLVLELADLMTNAGGDMSNTENVRNCIGSAVMAMGPERILKLLPISFRPDDFTCSNTWLIPLLRKHVVGASIGYYMENIVPLAKFFLKASRKAKEAATGQELQAHAHSLLSLLPAFCHYPTDIHKTFGSLAELLVIFLKKYPFMHEVIALSLQVLVNENRSMVVPKKNGGELSTDTTEAVTFGCGSATLYSEIVATRNLNALASSSIRLLQALVVTFVDSLPGTCSYLKDAIGCLASVMDSSITKMILTPLIEQVKFVDGKVDFENSPSQTVESVAEETENSDSAKTQLRRYVVMDLASSLVGGATDDLVELIYGFILQTFQTTEEIGHREAYQSLSRVLEEHNWFRSSHFMELIDMLLRLTPPADIASLRSRLACLHIMMVHAFKTSSDEEIEKAFLILNEIILTLKDGKEEARKAACDVLTTISTSLQNSSCDGTDSPCHKFISMIMGYLSGSSPHIKSGAVSALSVLFYKDPEMCLLIPELIPSLLSLLQTKAVEVIKAVLGFMKVVVSCLQFKDLRNLLSDIVLGILPWSSISRHHFRSKVTIILEIMIRKCGRTAVEFATPQKYKGFMKSVIENRSGKSSSKEGIAVSDTAASDSPKGLLRQKRKHRESDSVQDANDSVAQQKRRKGNMPYSNPSGSNKRDISANGDGSDRKKSSARSKNFGHGKKDLRRSSTNGLQRNTEKPTMPKRDRTAGAKSASDSKFHKGKKATRK